jgi:hypothetical protein
MHAATPPVCTPFSHTSRSIAMTAIDAFARTCEPHALDSRTSGLGAHAFL